ncbi:restriction endonuclease subunit S [Flavobacterium flavigenum]|uniref:restriction endonuclease subunit S n=1 Tax=Flavobacterium flavigenum TaxID=3003258 RepID=UPI002482955C|nr:restriction endonuclease subunit S [Flavobacterium flavigenum]
MSNQNKFIPELRFPDFENDKEWKNSTIGEIGKFYYGKSAPKWSLSSDAPTFCVRYGELYTKFDTIISEIKSRTNIDPSDLRFSKGGEILVPRVGEVAKDFASHCCYLPFPNVAIGEMISVYETKEYPIFYTYYFRTLEKEFARVVEGQNVKNLYYVNLEPIVIGKPSIDEQKKIADCLSSLDELITAHTNKLETLKTYKKGLMQNLFTQEGEKVPKLRFKEFEKDGEWKIERLDKVAEIITGNTPSTIETQYYNGEKLFVSPADINDNRHITNTKTKLSDLGFSKTRKIKENSVLFVCIGSTIGKIAQSKVECATNQQINSLTCFENYSNDFLYSVLEYNASNIADMAGNHAVPLINKSAFSAIELKFPPSLKEQKKIAETLSSVDSLIKEQSNKIEQLKLHKKGLMQGLFPKVRN